MLWFLKETVLLIVSVQIRIRVGTLFEVTSIGYGGLLGPPTRFQGLSPYDPTIRRWRKGAAANRRGKKKKIRDR